MCIETRGGGSIFEGIFGGLRSLPDILGAAVLNSDGDIIICRNFNGHDIEAFAKNMMARPSYAARYDCQVQPLISVGDLKVLTKRLPNGRLLQVFLEHDALTLLADLDIEGLIMQNTEAS